MGARLAGDEVHRPAHARDGQAHDAHVRAGATPSSRRRPPQMFGNAGPRITCKKYGSKPEHYVWIGWKNHKHSVNNPYAQFPDRVLAPGRSRTAPDDPRAADQAPVLPHVRRAAGRRAIVALGAVRRRARPVGSGDRDRRPGDDHRLPLEPRRDRRTCITIRRLRHEQGGRAARVRRGAGSLPKDRRRRRAARLLLRQRADHLRGRSGFAGEGRGPQGWSRPRPDHVRRVPGPVVQPLRRAGSPRATRLGATGLGPVLGAETGSYAASADKRQVDDVDVGVAAQHRPRRRPRS